MDSTLIDLIVLGEIPGTDVRLEFVHLAIVITILGLIGLCWLLYRTAVRSMRLIDPYHNAPPELTVIDLTAL